MRLRMPAAAGAALAAALLLAGCGSAGGVRVGPPEPGSTNVSSDCGDIVLDFSAGDVPSPICLSVGSTIRLRSRADAAAAREQGSALTEVSPGLYRGAAAGSAELSGMRRVCPETPGKVSCLAVADWRIDVEVR